ncbi:MAG: sugar transferase [Fusobacteriaceae bacterium]
MIYRNFFKRCIDVVGSGMGLVLLSPILLITAYLVKKDLGSPVIYRHERPGKHGKIFTLYKFRSMRDGGDNKLERLTPFGKKIRSMSIDELPELWNVLRGDMSLVGPRPLLVKYLPLYSQEQMRRHDVLPGITGLAQINGRTNITWEQKFKYDVEYVDNCSFLLDMKIIFLTIKKVLIRDDVKEGDEGVMDEFGGNL